MEEKQLISENEDKMRILSSIFEQTKKLADTLKSYQNFLYQKEQIQEAAEAEKFVEEEDAEPVKQKDETKKKKKKEEGGILSKIIGFIAFGLFAFLPAILSKAKSGIEFIKSFASNIKQTFFNIVNGIKETLNEYVIVPIKTFFTKTIPIAWNNIVFSMQDAIESMIDAPKTAMNSLLQLGNEIVINTIQTVITFIKAHESLINVITFGKGKNIVEGLEAESKKRKRSNEELQKERDRLEEQRKRAAEERESKDVAAEMREQADKRKLPAAKPISTEAAPVAEKMPAASIAKISGMEDVKKMIKAHEGVRYQAYKDSLGLWTIGVGHLIGDGSSPGEYANRTLTEKEVDDLFEIDFAKHVKIAEKTPGWDLANDIGKAAMIDLAFNMGAWWTKFKNTAKALVAGDFEKAADGLQDSLWYKQVKGRAVKIVNMIRNGKGKSDAENIAQTQSDSNTMAQLNSGNQINQDSMAAKIEAPPPAPIIVQESETTSEVATTETDEEALAPSPQQAQGLYQVHLAAARA